jgi:hypothetical protein
LFYMLHYGVKVFTLATILEKKKQKRKFCHSIPLSANIFINLIRIEEGVSLSSFGRGIYAVCHNRKLKVSIQTMGTRTYKDCTLDHKLMVNETKIILYYRLSRPGKVAGKAFGILTQRLQIYRKLLKSISENINKHYSNYIFIQLHLRTKLYRRSIRDYVYITTLSLWWRPTCVSARIWSVNSLNIQRNEKCLYKSYREQWKTNFMLVVEKMRVVALCNVKF